ncbi:NisI/SpaI family lantibiotic immunity lipoprotein [Caldifermentibacillus hisashii]|uniref:NisI/SpaI family lantibiotic immunity lipoprotein n=1 Tax=Caldifermentibacillus hisashii TaxID=996558 RepID=UPI001F4662C8|nr:NisI/SpaI family lantibiotic immunity lipoprotein [Caldifermentibacillus hisashii]
MKNSILLMAVAGVILLGGCSLLKDLKQTASENMEIDKTLPKYKLNMENFKEISYEGKTYVIQEAEMTKEDLDEPIGKVTETITINENNEILSKKELKKS